MKPKTFAKTVTLVVLLCAGSAQAAATYDFRYVDSILSAQTPGIAAGDVVTVNLFGNNGGSSIFNQSFNANDIAYFTIDAGTYHGSYDTAESSFALHTDAAGNVDMIKFFGTASTSFNSDNFGTWTGNTVFGEFRFDDFENHVNKANSSTFNTVNNWTVSEVGATVQVPIPAPAVPVSVPEPTMLALLGLGLAGIVSGRRKKIVA